MTTSIRPRRTTSPPEPSRRPRRWLRAAIAAAVLVVGLIIAFVWWFLRDDAPDQVSLDTAIATLEQETGSSAPSASSTTATSAASSSGSVAAGTGSLDATTTSAASSSSSSDALSGTWSVDTSVGEFDFEASTGTFVGFRVDEQLSSIGSTTAVGRTPEVSGTLTIDGDTVTDVQIEADMTALVTNESRRDDRARSALDTSQYPTATFRLTEPIELPADAADGATVSVTATGELTIKGVTRTVQIPLQAKVTNDMIVVVGSVDITFADYGVSVPSAPIVVSAEDHGPIELQLFFARS